MTFIQFITQCTPFLFLVILLTGLGGWTGRQFSQMPFIVNVILLIVCFAGFFVLHIYKRVHKVNLLLLGGLALLAGLLVGQTLILFTDNRSLEKIIIISATTVIVGIVIDLALAYILKVRFGYLSTALWFASIFYMLGWIVLAFLEDMFWDQTIWALVGILLFIILGVDTIAIARDDKKFTDPLPVVIDLSIVFFNLWFASLIASQQFDIICGLTSNSIPIACGK